MTDPRQVKDGLALPQPAWWAAIAPKASRVAGSPVDACPGRQSHRRAAGAGDRGVAAVALDRPRDCRGALDAALDGLGHPDPDRAGPARTTRPGSGRAL